MNDYIKYWFRPDIDQRSYSFWAADSVYNRYLVNHDKSFISDVLQDLIDNYRAWDDHRDQNGLYWQNDLLDAMEVQVGGSGYRPTINSYMYAGAKAISEMLELTGCSSGYSNIFEERADNLKKLVQNKLWNSDDEFFETMHRQADETVDVREEIGYVPWSFNLPDDNAGYDVAWGQLETTNGFKAPYGPTTVERRDPGFRAIDYCCAWNGTSWPYATTQTLSGLANLLNDYGRQRPGKGRPSNRLPVDKTDYFELLKRYTKTQHKRNMASGDSGERIPWIGESVNPLTGDWTTDTAHYFHSRYTDLIISGLVGLRPRADDVLEVNPLVPAKKWDYFALDNVPYHDHDISVIYDKNGQHYGMGQGLQLFVDGERVVKSGDPKLSRLTVQLPDDGDFPFGENKKPSLSSGTCPVSLEAVTFENQIPDNNTVSIDRVSIPNGGFVGIYDDTGLSVTANASRTGPYNGSPDVVIDGERSDDPDKFWSTYPAQDGSDWLELNFESQHTFTGLQVYIHSDGGGVKPPEDFTVQYQSGDKWVDVANQQQSPSTPQSKKNTLTFDPVTTNHLRVVFEYQNPDNNSGTAVTEIEWSIKDENIPDGKGVDDLIGVSDYLEGGFLENVNVPLFDVPGKDFESPETDSEQRLIAILHKDSNQNESFDFVTNNGNQDKPYTKDGEKVADRAVLQTTAASASYTSQYDQPSEAIDGIVSYGSNPRSRWTAYNSSNDSDWLQVAFADEHTFTELKLYVYNDGGGVQPPENYNIQYWDGSDWSDAVNQEKSPTTPQPKLNTVTFNPFTTTKFRVVFDHPANAYSGITEIRWETKT